MGLSPCFLLPINAIYFLFASLIEEALPNLCLLSVLQDLTLTVKVGIIYYKRHLLFKFLTFSYLTTIQRKFPTEFLNILIKTQQNNITDKIHNLHYGLSTNQNLHLLKRISPNCNSNISLYKLLYILIIPCSGTEMPAKQCAPRSDCSLGAVWSGLHCFPFNQPLSKQTNLKSKSNNDQSVPIHSIITTILIFHPRKT